MLPSINRKHLLIVSLGRTGTTYLQEMLARAENIKVLQEHPPSRLLYVLSNLSAMEILGVNQSPNLLAAKLYRHSRRRWLLTYKNKIFIEINPFLTNILPDVMKSGVAPEGVLHIVRNPLDWITSMIRFGAYSWRRSLVSFLPFVYYRPPYGTQGWTRLSLPRRLAHEWNFRNTRVIESGTYRGRYERIRYEDLFCDGRIDEQLLLKSLSALGFELAQPGQLDIAKQVVNASVNRPGIACVSAEDRKYIESITRTLARDFGYD